MEYRQLGPPSLQPQQQLGGFNYQAPRDLGKEQFLKGFAGLSESLVSAWQVENKQHIEKSLAEGEAWRKQSQKSFRDAVRDGEIHPSQNPHFAIGALRVDGDTNARKATTQWIGEWQAEVANPESTLSRTQGGFETFMLEKQAEWVEENPFVSQYDSNAFYDVSHRFIDGNAAKQNSEALERDLFLTTKKRADHIFGLAFGPDLGIPYAPEIIGTSGAQVEYDAMYADGGMSPLLQEMLLEKAYVLALTTPGVSPDEVVEKIGGLTQNGASLGETELGREVALKYKSKMATARNAFLTEALEDESRIHGRFLASIADFKARAALDFERWEVIDKMDPDAAGTLITGYGETLSRAYLLYGEVLPNGDPNPKYDPKLIGSLETDYQEAVQDLEIALTTSALENQKVAQFNGVLQEKITAGLLSNPTAYAELTEMHKSLFKGEQSDFDKKVWSILSTMSPEQRDERLDSFFQLGKSFAPYDNFLLESTSSVNTLMLAQRSGEVNASNIPTKLRDAFSSYADLHAKGRSAVMLKGNTGIVAQVFEHAVGHLGEGVTHAQALALALNTPTPAMESTTSRTLASNGAGEFNSTALVNAVTTAAEAGFWPLITDVNEGQWGELAPSLRQEILNTVANLAATPKYFDGNDKPTALKLAAEAVLGSYVLDSGSSLHIGALQNMGLTPEDGDAKDALQWLREDYVNASNIEAIADIRDRLSRFTGAYELQNIADRARDAGLERAFPVNDEGKPQYKRAPLRGQELEDWLVQQINTQGLGNIWKEEYLHTDGHMETTLEGLLEHHPAETMNYLNSQEWYTRQEMPMPEGFTGPPEILGPPRTFINPDDVNVRVSQSGAATFYIRSADGGESLAQFMENQNAIVSSDGVARSLQGFKEHRRAVDGVSFVNDVLSEQGHPAKPERIQEEEWVGKQLFGLPGVAIKILDKLDSMTDAGARILGGSLEGLVTWMYGDYAVEEGQPHRRGYYNNFGTAPPAPAPLSSPAPAPDADPVLAHSAVPATEEEMQKIRRDEILSRRVDTSDAQRVARERIIRRSVERGSGARESKEDVDPAAANTKQSNFVQFDPLSKDDMEMLNWEVENKQPHHGMDANELISFFDSTYDPSKQEPFIAELQKRFGLSEDWAKKVSQNLQSQQGSSTVQYINRAGQEINRAIVNMARLEWEALYRIWRDTGRTPKELARMKELEETFKDDGIGLDADGKVFSGDLSEEARW